jgi:outer membrane protein assembly factor BamC
MIKVIKLLVLVSVFSLSGCSFFYGENGLVKDNSYHYLESDVNKSINVPADLKQRNQVDYAPIPKIAEKAESSPIGKQLIVIPPVDILDVSDNVRVDKESSVPAIFIQENKAFLWSGLIDFFQSKEITPKTADAANYFLDTGWLSHERRSVWKGIENSQEIDEHRATYSFQIETVQEPEQLRLVVKQNSAQTFDEASKQWKDDSSFQDSVHIMNMFLAYYDRKVTERRIAATKKARYFNVSLGKDLDNSAALVTNANRTVVWQQLPKIFEQTNFNINDLDRKQMTYFFSYEKDGPGFFASLFGQEEKVKVPLEDGDYQATLSVVGELTAITFKDAQGNPLSDEVMAKIFPSISQYFGKKV